MLPHTLPGLGFPSKSASNNLDSTAKNPDDVVITLAIRTPLTKGGKGGFKDTPLDAIVVKLLKQVVKRMNLDPALVEDVCLGNVRNKTCLE
jgi:acetyl-CoA acyltransferase 1